MDIVTINPSLSLFQQQLLAAKQSGMLSEEGLLRIRDEGAVLVEKTVERFFTSTAKEDTYMQAARMVEFILSFSLSQKSVNLSIFETVTLNQILQHGLKLFKEIEKLPANEQFPNLEKEETQLQKLHVSVLRKNFSVSEYLIVLLNDWKIRRESHKKHLLVEHIICLAHPSFKGREGAAFFSKNHAQTEACDSIIFSHLFSAIFNLREGYDLSPQVLVQAIKRTRPPLAEVQEILQKTAKHTPDNLVEEYLRAIDNFLNNSILKGFFQGRIKKVERLYLGPEAPLYTSTMSYEASTYYKE